MVIDRLHDNGRLHRRPQIHPERRVLPPAAPLVRAHADPAVGLSALAADRPEALLHVFVDAAGHFEVWRAGRMFERVLRFAGALARDGVVGGDRVLLGIAEPLDLVTAWHACGWLGAAPLVYGRPLGRRRDGHWRREMVGLIDELDPAVVLIDDDFAERATEHVRVTDAVWRRVREVEQARAADPPSAAADAHRIAFYSLTQGTSTGAPRAIGIEHASLMARVDDLVARCDGRSTDLVCSWLPLNPRNGLLPAVLLPALFGTPSVLIDPMGFIFEPAAWLWAMHAFRASISTAPGRGYDVCARAVTDADLLDLDLSAWRLAVVGGEMTHPEHLDGFEVRLGPHGFQRRAFTAMYGGAETLGMATCGEIDAPPMLDEIDADRLAWRGEAGPAALSPTTMVGVGRCMSGVTVRVVAGDGRPLGERQLGEVELLDPTMGRAPGAPPETAADWLRTGDTGYLVDDELVVCGRWTDLLRIDGRRFPAIVVERALDRLVQIRWGCVVVDAAPPDAEQSAPVVIFEHTMGDPDGLAALVAEVEAIFTDVVGRPPARVVPVRQQGLPRAPNGQLRRARVLAMLKANVLPPPLPGLRLLR